jgi:hypothetical protein
MRAALGLPGVLALVAAFGRDLQAEFLTGGRLARVLRALALLLDVQVRHQWRSVGVAAVGIKAHMLPRLLSGYAFTALSGPE